MRGSTILSYISILKGYDIHGGDEGDLPEGDFTSLTIYVKSQTGDFNHAFSHEDRSGKNLVRDEA